MASKMDEQLYDVAVLGACGKMGRGISLLLLQEMALLALKKNTPADNARLHLKLIDANGAGFFELKSYLAMHLTKYAEKNINRLRELVKGHSGLISNSDVIDAFKEKALAIIDCSTAVAHAKGSKMVFEAAFEEIPLKINLLKSVAGVCPEAWVFTNTSSIPIGLLAKESGLRSNLIGLHFYNPPPIQKLLEIIPAKGCDPQLETIAKDIAKRFNKIAVTSADIAGFIGNGHFAREIHYACEMTRALCGEYSREEAMQVVDTVTRDFLLRPMGIFSLLDYVGLPIAHHIFGIMRDHIPDPKLKEPLMDELLQAGLKGGQTIDGEPKAGIFQYEGSKPVAIYSFSKKTYVPLAPLTLGPMPMDLSWKKIQKEKKLEGQIMPYMEKLLSSNGLGCKLATHFMENSAAIVELLVSTHVAHSYEDVATVLKNGFFHLYSPYDVLHKLAVKKK